MPTAIVSTAALPPTRHIWILLSADAGSREPRSTGRICRCDFCYNVLEFVDDPSAVLRSASQLMRGSSVLSILVRTQAGDSAGAERSVTAERGCEAHFGGKVRLFTPESLNPMVRQASLRATAPPGVRVVSGYLPPTISQQAQYERILHLGRKLGSLLESAVVAPYAQFLLRRTTPEPEHDT